MAVSAKQFFDKIVNDLYKDVYLALGGSIEDQTFDWANRLTHFGAIGIKITVLLTFIGFWYWILVYISKRSQGYFGIGSRHVKIMRSVLRYSWFIASVLAIMTQVGAQAKTIKAVAKASSWAGFFYVMLAMNGQILHWLLRHYDINESIEQLVRNLMLVFWLVLAAALILAQFGFDIVSLVAGLGIVGLAVGFAAQSTLANFIAGITILIEQSFQVGDWVRVGNQEGRVVKITLRTTHILNRNNIVIIFPNSTVASTDVVNLTSKTFIRFDVPVRIALNANVATARSLILKVLKTNDNVLEHPLSTVTLSKVGEYDLHLIVRFWVLPTSVARLPLIKEQIIERIKTTLDSENLTTPYPHMQLISEKPSKESRTLIFPEDG